jgi:hypothetical protein
MVFVPQLAEHFRWRRDSGLLVPWRVYDYVIELHSQPVQYQLDLDEMLRLAFKIARDRMAIRTGEIEIYGR